MIEQWRFRPLEPSEADLVKLFDLRFYFNFQAIRSKPKMATFKLIGSHYEAQKVNSSGFVVIGAGLPRTGTSSMREALAIILVKTIQVIKIRAAQMIVSCFTGANESI